MKRLACYFIVVILAGFIGFFWVSSELERTQEINKEFKRIESNLGVISKRFSRVEFLFKRDGQYDFSSLLLQSPGFDYQAMQASFVWLKTECEFFNSDERRSFRAIVRFGTGTVVCLPDGFPRGKYILTAAHVVRTGEEEIAQFNPYGSGTQKTKLCYKGRDIEIQLIALNEGIDVALFKLPDDVDIPAFPYRFGKSEDLSVGNVTYIFGRPFSSSDGIAREGIVGSGNALKMVTPLLDKEGLLTKERIEIAGNSIVSANDLFCITNGLNPGDSGSLVLALRDGVPEIIGIVDAVIGGAEQLGFALKIDPILAKIKLAFDKGP